MFEKLEKEILVENIPYDIFIEVLKYLYTGISIAFVHPHIDILECAIELLLGIQKVAKEFQLERLELLCEKKLNRDTFDKMVPPSTLLADFTKARKDQKYTDLTLKLDDHTIECHRVPFLLKFFLIQKGHFGS